MDSKLNSWGCSRSSQVDFNLVLAGSLRGAQKKSTVGQEDCRSEMEKKERSIPTEPRKTQHGRENRVFLSFVCTYQTCLRMDAKGVTPKNKFVIYIIKKSWTKVGCPYQCWRQQFALGGRVMGETAGSSSTQSPRVMQKCKKNNSRAHIKEGQNEKK